MSDVQFRRDLSRLLRDFKPHQMQWPDVVKSLRQLKALLRQHSSLRVPEPDLLSRSLMVCLHPSWPQGLHAEALEVFASLLFPDTAVYPFDAEIACYANSLFAFYEFAAPENKLTLLKTFQRLIDTYVKAAGYFMPGFVLSLLPGLEDPGNKEATPQILGLFETLARLDDSTFHAALWVAVLRTSSEGRYGALACLHRRKDLFIPNRQLVLNALIACLEDTDIRVRRSALDLIKEKVNILHTGQLLDEEKVALLVAALRSPGRANDQTLVRRVKEWVVPSEYTTQYTLRLSEYCSQAAALLLKSFSESEDEVQTSKAILHSLLGILDETPELKAMLLRRLASVLITHVYKNTNSPCIASLLTLISEFVTDESSMQTWESLSYELSSALSTPRLAETLSVIDFALNNLPLDKSDTSALQPTIRLLLEHFEALQKDCQPRALIIAKVLLGKAETAPKSTCFQRYLQALAQDTSRTDLLQTAMHICIALEEPGNWIEVVHGLCEGRTEEQVLAGIEGSLLIHSNNVYTAFRDSAMPRKVFDLLWSRMNSAVSDRVIRLLVDWYRLPLPDSGFSGFICEKLRSLNAKTIQQFSTLWSCLRHWPEDLSVLFYSGKEVFHLLAGLESDSPQIRHAVREWLLDSLPTSRYILDPCLEPLLALPATTHTDKHRHHYTSQYDTQAVLQCLKHLRSLLLRGGDKLYTWMQDNKLSMRLGNLSLEDCDSTYLALLLKATLKLVQNEASRTDMEFYAEDQAARFSACEVIERVLERGETGLAFAAASCCLGVAIAAIQDQNSLFQLQLLGILRTALLACHHSGNARRCRELFSSPDLRSMLTSSIESKDAYLRSHWTEFICQLFPVTVRWMSGKELADCTKQLTHTFAEIIRVEEAKEHAFQGLTAVIETIVDLPESRETLFFVEEFKIEHKAKESSGWLSSLFSSKPHPSVPDSPFDSLNNALISQLERIFQGCQTCLSAKDLGFHASPKGLVVSDKAVDRWVEDQFSESIRKVLSPLFRKWPVEFIAAEVTLWLTSSKLEPVRADSPALVNLIRLFSYIGLSPMEILGSLTSFLEARIENFRSISEVNLIHFLVTLLLSYPREAYPLVLEEQRLFLGALLRVLEELDAKLGAKVEVQLWLIEFLVYLNRLFPFAPVLSDKPIKLKLQELVKGLLGKVCRRCTEKSPALAPFPPSITQLAQDIIDTQTAAFRVLSVHLYPVLKLAYEGSDKELREQLRGPIAILTNGLAKRDIPIDMLTALLHALVISEGEFITDVLRDTLASTLRSLEFFQSLQGNKSALRQWGGIVEKMTLSDPRDRDRVLADALAEIPSGMFTSRVDVLKGTVKALKTVAFLIYSGGENSYLGALPRLLERLTNEFCGDDVLPSAFLVLRALALHLSQQEWEDFYLRLRPYLLMRLTQGLREGQLRVKTAAMKMLELLVSLGYEKFTSSQWLFLYDTPNVCIDAGSASTFQPLVPASLLPSYHGRLENSDETNISVYSKPSFNLRAGARQCFFKSAEYASEEEFLGKGEPFVQYMISSSVERLVAARGDLVEALEIDMLHCEEIS